MVAEKKDFLHTLREERSLLMDRLHRINETLTKFDPRPHYGHVDEEMIASNIVISTSVGEVIRRSGMQHGTPAYQRIRRIKEKRGLVFKGEAVGRPAVPQGAA